MNIRHHIFTLQFNYNFKGLTFPYRTVLNQYERALQFGYTVWGPQLQSYRF